MSAVRAARERLVLSIFRCDDAAVPQALAAAVQRGVRVRVLMTARARAAAADLDALEGWLAARGVDVRRFAGMKYHAKYLVADARLAVVTTLSLTTRCFERTCDFTLVSRDAAVATGLSEMFDADWDGRPVRLTAPQRERLIVGPDGQPRDRFAALMRDARRRIRIVDGKVTDPRLAALLEARQRAGVSVERARRRQVRPLRRHGKLLLIDRDAAVIGSLALSNRGLERRRELAIVTRDPRSIAELDAFWQTQVSHRAAAVGLETLRAGMEMPG
jgi:phosphatidylserine/phosphatidylglycerophosphate/cardiolipin synthase-like enzyme